MAMNGMAVVNELWSDVPQSIIDFHAQKHRHKRGQLVRVQDRNIAIARLLATGVFTNKQVAEILNVSPKTVYRTKESQVMAPLIADMRLQQDKEVNEAVDVLRDAAKEMAQQLVDIASNEDVKVADRLRAIDSGLDRAGVGRKTEHTVTENRHISIDYIKRLATETLNDNLPSIEAIFEEIPNDDRNQLPLPTPTDDDILEFPTPSC